MAKELLYIRQETVDNVSWIRFHRPEKLNAVNPAVLRELEQVLVCCEEDSQVKAVVLTGNDKAFVAGADIDNMATCGVKDAYVLTDLTMQVQNRLAKLAKPTIAAISGYALGAGCEIALCCDFRLATDTAIFGLPEITLGIIPGGGGTQRLTRLVNLSTATKMIMLGVTVKADEALATGLVDKVVARDVFQSEVQNLAGKLCRLPGLALYAAKKAMHEGFTLELDTALQLEQKLFCELFTTEDRTEGMTAFMEKRKPVYKGK